MLDELFRIPHEIFGLPVFGWGWALIAWALGGAVVVAVVAKRHGWGAEVRGLLPVLAIGAAAMVFLMPRLEQPATAHVPQGLPLRGYGFMVTLGILAGGALAARQARQNGIDPDDVFGLAFHCFVGGIVGARTFYVVQYRDEYFYGPISSWSRAD